MSELRYRLPTSGWTVFYSAVSVISAFLFVWGFFQDWSTRDLVGLAFFALYLDPSDNLIIRAVQRLER